MKIPSLEDWLVKISSYHPAEIKLGLDRVGDVAKRLNISKPSYPVITIAGTNGKGSTVAGLEAIYLANGYRVGTFTSPFLFSFNELVRIDGRNASNAVFLQSFNRIEEVRGETTLTPFEYHTLAALMIFEKSDIDVGLLEVGLGGRLDAVNIIDANLAIITSIGLDHVALLGDTREKIAVEKAGIMRAKTPVVCGDFDPPSTLTHQANQLQAPFYCQGKEFHFVQQETTWDWWNETTQIKNLPLPQLALQNMSTVLQAVDIMQLILPVRQASISTALRNLHLPGRIQTIKGKVTTILDVSHNPAAAAWLADYLQQNACRGKTRAVFSMLSDKDIQGTLNIMHPQIDEWHIAPLPTQRGASISCLETCLQKLSIQTLHSYPSVVDAFKTVEQISHPDDRIVVFGSFHTVSDVALGCDLITA